MKLNKQKYELAKARACMSSTDIIKAGIAKGTLLRATSGEDIKPDTVGRIAKALGVDVTEIID